MSKKYLLPLLTTAFVVTASSAFAEIPGLEYGGYSAVRQNQMPGAYENAVNEAAYNFSNNSEVIPAKSTVTSSGVNSSKTIYTDELGRLHFFGRANRIKE